MKKVYYCIFAALVFISCTKEEPIPTLDFNISSQSVAAQYTTASVVADFQIAGATGYQLYYSQQKDMSSALSADFSKSGSGYSCQLSGLQAATPYYYQFRVIGDYNSAPFGDVLSFSTNPYTQAEVSTDQLIAYDHHNAIVAATLHSWGCDDKPEWGVCYATHSGAEYTDSRVESTGSTSSSLNISGLTDSTTYYVRAYAKNREGIAYGSELSFMTVPYLLPTVETYEATSVSTNAAICYGSVTADGDLHVSEKGFCYSTSANPSVSATKISSAVAGIGQYSCALQGLSSGTTYYVRAYAINAKGVAYGNQITFTTSR